jgi:mRNA interferase RelE/StbE
LAYKHVNERSALKDFKQVPSQINPYQGKALSGEFKGLYRWCSGKFRIIYEIQQEVLVVLVLKIGHRSDVYR